MKRLAWIVLSLLAFTSVAAADAKPPASAAAKPPAPPPPPPELKKTIDAFTGSWSFTGTVAGIPGMKDPVKVTEVVNCQHGALAHVVSCTGKGGPGPMGPYADVALITYNAEEKNVRFVGMDSEGVVHDHKCNWKDDKTLACETLTITAMGKPATVEFSVTWANANEAHFVESTKMADGTVMTFDGVGKKK